jgi:hypothetical protein
MEDVVNRAAEAGAKLISPELKDHLSNIGESLGEIGLTEATIPDAFSKAPKFISPRVHSWLDAAVTGYFVVLGIVFTRKGRKGAATAAFVNAGLVAGVSMFTDYNGTGEKPISFKMHGTLDALQASTAALAPLIHGFAGKPESAFFYGQAANEVAVIASTDWDEGMPSKRRKKAA